MISKKLSQLQGQNLDFGKDFEFIYFYVTLISAIILAALAVVLSLSLVSDRTDVNCCGLDTGSPTASKNQTAESTTLMSTDFEPTSDFAPTAESTTTVDIIPTDFEPTSDFAPTAESTTTANIIPTTAESTNILPTTESTTTDESNNCGATTSDTTAIPVSKQCGGPGWRRVAFINMTDPNQNCPQGLYLTSFSLRSCGRSGPAGRDGVCNSVFFPVNGIPYSKVCGRALGYRYSVQIGFYGYHYFGRGLNEQYVDGISLTHGVGDRTHIWTFVSGHESTSDGHAKNRCPCNTNNPYSPPPFVGNDYICESVLSVDLDNVSPDNALWDGQGCVSHNLNCCEFNNPPWFMKVLSNSTCDDIELRLCLFHRRANLAVEQLELYVAN